ncbi:MAG: NEW3 domain-containing protein, partial [Nanoarchaeota archaeon]
MANPGDPSPYDRWRWGMIGYDLDDVGGWREDAVDNYTVQVSGGPLYIQVYMKNHINAQLPGGAMYTENTMRIYPINKDYLFEHNLTYDSSAHSYGGYIIPRSYYTNDWLDWMQSWNFADDYWSGQAGYLRVGYDNTACSAANPGPCKFTIASPSWNQPVSSFNTNWMAWCDGSNEEVGIIWNGIFNGDTYSNYGASSYGELGGFDRETYTNETLNATLYWLISNNGEDGNLTNKISNYKLNTDIISQGSLDAGFTSIIWIKTINTSNSLGSFFSKNSKIRIETNVTSPGTGFPKLTIYYPNGSTSVDQLTMINSSSTIYYYDYNLTGEEPTGYYDVKIEGSSAKYLTRTSLFYVGNTWPDQWNSGAYHYSKSLNITEPGISDRILEPVDVNVNFTNNAHNDSIRIVLFDGTNYTEIPSQIYNISTAANGLVDAANVVFLSSLSKNENKTYYIVWRTNSLPANYSTDLNYTNNNITGFYQISNAFYNLSINKSFGGLLQDAQNRLGSRTTLSGIHPMEYYPEARINIPPATTFSVREFTDPTITLETGPVFIDMKINGSLSGNINYPYNFTYRFFSNTPYYLKENNITALETKTWNYIYDNYLGWVDEKFTNSAYKNTTGNITTSSLAAGDNTDITDLDADISWLAVYNSNTGDAMGDIFLARNQTTQNTPKIDLYDDTYEYYQRAIISASQSISSGSSFYNKIARMIWYGGNTYESIDTISNQLFSPILYQTGTQVAYDTTSPSYNFYNFTPSNPSDDINITCYSFWTDNLEMDYVLVEENTTGIHQNHTASISSVSGSGNYTINANVTNAGIYACRFHGFDSAGNTNSTPFININITDSTAPNFQNTTNVPSTNSSLDPNVTITINSSFLEYSTVDTVKLFYRYNNGTWSSWDNLTMENIGQTNYNYTYETNLTPIYEAEYQYYIYANDTNSNAQNSTTYNLSIFYDYTWDLTSNLTANSADFDTNISLGNITINNTGDFDLSFTLTAGVFNSRIYINESQASNSPTFTIQNKTSQELNITGTTRPGGQTEGTDTVTLTINATEAVPSSNSAQVALITTSGGPFLFTQFTEYPASVTQGDSNQNITAKVTNLGNETATNTNITITLPAGWTSALGTTSNLGTLTVGSFNTYAITADVASDAATGTQTFTASSICAENKTGTGTATVTVTALPTTPGNNTETTTTAGSSSGGGGGSSFSAEEASRFFQTEQTFELTRGEDQKFVIVLANPYDDAVLENVDISLKGFSEDYINFEPKQIGRLGIGDTIDITVEINAPAYFTKGDYLLEFTFEGDVNRINNTRIKLKYTKKVLLQVFEVSRTNAESYIELSNQYIQDMISKNMTITKEIKELNESLSKYYNETDFKQVKDIYEKLEEIYNSAIESDKGIKELEANLNEAEDKNINVEKTKRLLYLAKSSFERGDYLTAIERVNEAKLTLAIETKGQFFKEALHYVKNNKPESAGALAAFGFFIFSASMFTRWRYIKRKLKNLTEEEKLLMELMKAIQIEVFEKAKMSMEEYGQAMTQYEKRLGEVLQERITFENR